MTLKYPSGAGGNGSDYVIFTPVKYQTNNSQKTGDASGTSGFASSNEGGAPPLESGMQSVILYMPNSTPAMGNQNDWNKLDFNGPIGDMRRDISGSVGKNMAMMMEGGSFGEVAGSVGEDLKGGISSLKDRFKGVGAQLGMQALGSVLGTTPNQMLALGAGKVFNPNVELLYNAPQMRGFAMSFDMIPKDATESNIINEIILNFKKMSAPKDLKNGMFEVPYVWDVRYMTGSGVNKNMNRFKKAACTNVQVQANQPTSMHVSHPEGVPIITSIQLTFTEVDIITREDHEKVGGQGY